MIVLRRLASALPVIAGVIIVTFLLTRALPGDPAVYFAGTGSEPAGDRRRFATSWASTAACRCSSSIMSNVSRMAISAPR